LLTWTTTRFLATLLVLEKPLERRRLVRTQIEELLALYRHYPLPEFESVRQILTQLQQAYSDVEPFNHPLLAALDDPDQEDDAAWQAALENEDVDDFASLVRKCSVTCEDAWLD
jgi:hypothetical protein